jgi:hypothetical protein
MTVRPGPFQTLENAGELVTVKQSAFRFIAAQRHFALLQRNRWTESEGFDALRSHGQLVQGGRGPNRLLPDAIQGRAIRIRPMRHGGTLRALLGDRYLSPARVQREFQLWTWLRAHLVPLVEPVFAGSSRSGLFWRSSFATIECPDALDGLAWLKTNPTDEVLTRSCESVARALHQLHDLGVLHGDLNLRNILFEADPDLTQIRCYLIDLDRARKRSTVSPAARMREWMRLARSVEKEGAKELFSQRLRTHLLNAYCDGDVDLRERMLSALPREHRRLARHRWMWRLSSRARGRDSSSRPN